MAKKCYLLIIICFMVDFTISAHKSEDREPASTEMSWSFYSTLKLPSEQELSQMTVNHKLGKDIAFLWDKFYELYAVKEEVIPGDPTTRIVIKKPEIYNAVRKIEKCLLRKISKDNRSTKEAHDQMSYVLQVALAAIDSDTSSFEKILQKNKKDYQSQINIFKSVTLENIY